MVSIWAAFGTDMDRRYSLGYFAGDKDDITQFLTNTSNVGYGLELDEVIPKKVTREMANFAEKTNKRIEELEHELKRLKKINGD